MDLELAETTDLVKELIGRFDFALFIGELVGKTADDDGQRIMAESGSPDRLAHICRVESLAREKTLLEHREKNLEQH